MVQAQIFLSPFEASPTFAALFLKHNPFFLFAQLSFGSRTQSISSFISRVRTRERGRERHSCLTQPTHPFVRSSPKPQLHFRKRQNSLRKGRIWLSEAMPQFTDRLKLPNIVDPVIRDKLDPKHLHQVASVAMLCVQPEPSYRPLITDVLHSLSPLVPV